MKLLMSALIALSVPFAVRAQRPPPIIDMHLHASAEDRYANGPVPMCRPAVMGIRPEQCPDTLWSSTLDDPVMEATVAVLERRNIFGVLAGPVELVRKWVAAAPDRFIPAADPQSDGVPNPTSSPDELRPLFESGEFRVLAEMDPQFAGVAPDDPTLEPYWAMAEALDIPVGIHMGEGPPGSGRVHAFSDYRARLTDPFLLEEVLARHPDLRVYVMHYGSPMIDEMIAMLYTYPQLYVDIGGQQWVWPREYFYRHLRELVEAGFGDRIMFGSDQMIWPQVIEPAIGVIEEAPFLSDEQKRDILYDNAARFLRLSDEEIARHHGG